MTELALGRIRERVDTASTYSDWHQVGRHAQVLLDALEKVLDLHKMQETPVKSYNLAFCSVHSSPPAVRPLSWFAEVRNCPDCEYAEYYVCSHCRCPHDEWPCPTVRVIREALGINTE